VAALIVPNLPADLNTALTGFAATIAAKTTEANNARASLLLLHVIYRRILTIINVTYFIKKPKTNVI
jgi:hypothetical protein